MFRRLEASSAALAKVATSLQALAKQVDTLPPCS